MTFFYLYIIENNNKNMKKRQSKNIGKEVRGFNISNILYEKFKVISSAMGDKMGDIVEQSIRDYCIKNKVEASERIKRFWEEK